MRRYVRFGLSSILLLVFACAVAVNWWREDLRHLLAKNKVSPPLGFEGYCVVSMHRDFKWVRGDPRWNAIHEGRLYYFVDERAQTEFLRESARYAPEFSGDDVVEFSRTGKRIAGERRFGATYQAPRDASPRIYLFASEDALQVFERDPIPYVDNARKSTVRSSSP
jgi:protein disulfide-isomerase